MGIDNPCMRDRLEAECAEGTCSYIGAADICEENAHLGTKWLFQIPQGAPIMPTGTKYVIIKVLT